MVEQVEFETSEHPVVMRDYWPPTGEGLWLLFPHGTKPDRARAYFRREYGYDALAVRSLGRRLAVGPFEPGSLSRKRRGDRILPG